MSNRRTKFRGVAFKGITSPWLTCECGKRGYPNRGAAKKALRRAHPDGNRMHAYQCDVDSALWHVGHTPEPIKRGEVDRHTYYARRASR